MKKIKQGKAMESNEGGCCRKAGRDDFPDKVMFEQESRPNGVVEQDIWLLGKNVPGEGTRWYKTLEIGMLKDVEETSRDGWSQLQEAVGGELGQTTETKSCEPLWQLLDSGLPPAAPPPPAKTETTGGLSRSLT